jgi:type VI protein secretion system component Hcp
MKWSMVTKLGLLVLVVLVASAVVAALAFGHSTRQARIAAPPASVQLTIKGFPPMTVLSFSVKLTNTITLGSASGGAGIGKAKFSDMTLTVPIDASTPAFSTAVARGDVFQIAKLTDKWTNATGNLVAVTDGLTNLYITSLEQDSGASGPGSAGPTETITLLAEQSGWSYFANGDPNSTPTAAQAWSQLTNQSVPCGVDEFSPC